MRITQAICLGMGLLTMFALASLTPSQEPAVPTPLQGNPPDPIEIQTRGPLHEAYAQPFEQQPAPGSIVPKVPPAPIPEDPPAERLANDNAQWIPGYWAWDAERQQFMWVSGVQRVPPQGRQFVPGYWSHTAEGWRWIPGFWSDANQPDVPYTPEPPAPLDNGPQMDPPDADSIYVPGVWIYRSERFIWRPGYYAPVRVGRVWVPSHYVWTPNGYLFIEGYWDWPYEDRGLVYAPVCFNRPLWHDVGWRYRPSHVVSFNLFFDSAFVRLGGCHFYFGNYYGPNYARLGYNPWFNGRGRYDPTFAYYGWQNQRNNPNWVNGQQQVYADRAAGRAAVPPRNFAQQTEFIRERKGAPIVVPAPQIVNTQQVRLAEQTPAQLDTQRAAIQRNRELAVNRQQADVAATKAGNFNRPNEPRTFRLPAAGNATNPAPQVLTFPNNQGNKGETKPPVFQPKNNDPPRVNPPPAPIQPKNVTPPPLQPKNNPLPKAEIKNNDPPRINPPPAPIQPKNVNPAPVNPPAPKVEIRNNPPPAFNPPPAPIQPKNVNPPPAPKVNTPPPAPAQRINNPPPA